MMSDKEMYKAWSFGPSSFTSLFKPVDERAPDNHPAKIAAIEYNKKMDESLKSVTKSLCQTIDADIMGGLMASTYTNIKTINCNWFNKK